MKGLDFKELLKKSRQSLKAAENLFNDNFMIFQQAKVIIQCFTL